MFYSFFGAIYSFLSESLLWSLFRLQIRCKFDANSDEIKIQNFPHPRFLPFYHRLLPIKIFNSARQVIAKIPIHLVIIGVIRYSRFNLHSLENSCHMLVNWSFGMCDNILLLIYTKIQAIAVVMEFIIKLTEVNSYCKNIFGKLHRKISIFIWK